MTRVRVGVDSGGTFTDFVVVRSGRIAVFKKFSTPGQPAVAILSGLVDLGPAEVIHGSTVATNALLERKGARVALLTTAGFEDILVIGRQTRRELYNIFVQRPPALVPDHLRVGIRERILFDGKIEHAIDEEQVLGVVATLKEKNIESVAVCFLFSFANTKHEEIVGNALKSLGVPVSLSCRILPEFREYERTSTTVINAYLAPTMSRYLTQLGSALGGSKLRVMQSNGGTVTSAVAAESPVRTIVSGPAGGVVGAYHIAALSGHDDVITFDMGGTSTDVALCEGAIGVTHEAEVDGFPVGIPMIDIHTVGAGGGSIAELDAGGALRVGPQSAGADPGPICYGRGGTQLTVTDANVLLGRLPPRFFLGGTQPLAVDQIRPAVARLPWAKTWRSPEMLAQGIVDVVNNNMEQAIRLISVERGHDPRAFALVSFGGAGGLHAADLARALSIPRVLIPPMPGALSALGLLLANAQKDYSRSLLVPVAGSESLVRRELNQLHRRGQRDMELEGFGPRDIRHQDFVDLRYKGQSYDLTVTLTRDFARAFHRLHQQRYGYSDVTKPIEIVNVRSSFTGRVPKIRLAKHPRTRIAPRPVEIARVWFSGKAQKAGIYDRSVLGSGNIVRGPAIIGEYSSTTLIPPDFVCEVDAYLNLVLRPAIPARRRP